MQIEDESVNSPCPTLTPIEPAEPTLRALPLCGRGRPAVPVDLGRLHPGPNCPACLLQPDR